ncbi:methyltransferase domain-containing protein [Natronoarchaeum mannanilyticum]|uniref:tRNA (guanine(10)-N(2))-dimethyltransferase n=1 Tax=Natronoarchaeum mannanilyticum TaxID=926360 RepID=A0AAV3T7X6_9EURY
MYLLELGGEDDRFAACEARSAAASVELLAPGLATAGAVERERVETLAYARRASELVGLADADVESASALLSAAAVDREGSVAVRTEDVRGSTGVDTQRVERELGGVLVDRGFDVDLDDPDHVLRALFSDPSAWEREGQLDPRDADGATGGISRGDDLSIADRAVDGEAVCALGWVTAESRRDFGERAPTDRPFFQPGSMDPLLARALANLAGARPGALVVDPMCGTGGVLIEAGLAGADVLGTDAQAKMARGAARNLAHALPTDAAFGTARGDATQLPLPDDAADAVVFDAPYGRQSKIANLDLADLVAGALAEARRIAPRAVVVADRPWDAEARAAGWRIENRFERRVHRSLDRHILVLERDDRGSDDVPK